MNHNIIFKFSTCTSKMESFWEGGGKGKGKREIVLEFYNSSKFLISESFYNNFIYKPL